MGMRNRYEMERNIAAEEGGKIVWRTANCVMTAFFLMAAGVQYNDPDPYLWMPLYGTAAVLTLSIVIWPNSPGNRLWYAIYLLLTLYCGGMFLYAITEFVVALTHPSSDGSINPLAYEEGREMAGVMITSSWIFICNQAPTLRCTCPRWCLFGFSRKNNERANFELSDMQELDFP